MKIKLLTLALILLTGLPLLAAPPQERSAKTSPAVVDNTTFIDVNNILMFVTNHGNFGRDLGGVFGNDFGTYWPYNDTASISSGAQISSPFYAGGLWVGAVDSATGDTLVVVSEYSSEYVPGPMQGGTFLPDAPAFRVYKLFSDSTFDNANAAWLNWPNLTQGAPMAIDTIIDTIAFDTLGDSLIDADTTYSDPYPGLIGDQMCWAVFNDANPAGHTNNNGETAPLGLEVRQASSASTGRWTRRSAISCSSGCMSGTGAIRCCRIASSLFGPTLIWAWLETTWLAVTPSSIWIRVQR
jgi:hypothetical protein